MRTLVVTDFDAWRTTARKLLAADVSPEEVRFHDSEDQGDLFAGSEGEELPEGDAATSTIMRRVPKKFIELARRAGCHRDRHRFNLLYRVLWRLTHGEGRLLEISTDDDVDQLNQLEKAVRRDAHKMKAFVRFRRVLEDGQERFVAWHRPDHRIVCLVAPFFSRRFPQMQWMILTPDKSVAWDLSKLTYGPGAPRDQAPQADELEGMWRTYYASIFNPARIKLKAMTREMPVRHWGTLPETQIIPDLLADAPRRVKEMVSRQEGSAASAADYLPEVINLETLRAAAVHCQGCDLHRPATQTVFGEGPVQAQMVLVGEQPGDQEDLAGHPFVGPAGEVLDRALKEAGIDRSDVYVTNAVKHFKYTPRGKRRLHKKPDARETYACQGWLEAELGLIEPQVLICLGATAGQVLMGRDFRITQQRGEFFRTSYCANTIATYHPSAVLRSPVGRRGQVYAALVRDLRYAMRQLNSERPAVND